MSLLMQELLGMDKAGSYSETGGQRGGGYNQEDKYEKEKNVRKKSWIFGRNVTIKSIHCWLGMFFLTSQNALKENFHFQNFMKEMEIMKKLHHPNLVKMYGICVDKLPFYIILVHLLKWLVRWYIEEETIMLWIPGALQERRPEETPGELQAGHWGADQRFVCLLQMAMAMANGTAELIRGERMANILTSIHSSLTLSIPSVEIVLAVPTF